MSEKKKSAVLMDMLAWFICRVLQKSYL